LYSSILSGFTLSKKPMRFIVIIIQRSLRQSATVRPIAEVTCEQF
jgi:hypothetical protein